MLAWSCSDDTKKTNVCERATMVLVRSLQARPHNYQCRRAGVCGGRCGKKCRSTLWWCRCCGMCAMCRATHKEVYSTQMQSSAFHRALIPRASWSRCVLVWSAVAHAHVQGWILRICTGPKRINTRNLLPAG